MDTKAIITNLGFLTYTEFVFKFVLPITGVCSAAMLAMFHMRTILDVIPFFMPYLIFAFGVAFVLLYPYINYEKKKIDINNNLHYFITYIGSISTLQLTRTDLFKHVAEKESFGEISKISKKILYLAKSWNLGYAHTCRKIAAYTPSPVFSDFLDRFAAIMDFGQNIEVFLIDEQESVLEDYSVAYKKSMENIRMLQEVFISMTVATGFAMSISLLLPLVMGISVELVVRYSLVGVIIIDLFLYFLIRSIIPSDKLCHSLKKVKSKERLKAKKVAIIVIPITALLLTLLLLWNPFSFLVNIGIGILPLLIVGYYGAAEEKKIFSRDKSYPAFVRTLGSVTEIKEGAVISSISALQVHDFGSLNDLVVNVYRRLRLGCDKFQTWFYFSGESGSNLIHQFTQIFSESIYLGGNGQKIGEIIASNFNKLLSLRRFRIQLASGLKGAFYGALVGFSASAYITAKISQTLSEMFSAPFDMAQDTGEVADAFGNILPPAPAVNLELVLAYIGLMVIVHALICSLTVKVIDGGSPYAFFQDFVLMIWIGAVISVVVPDFVSGLLPSGGPEMQTIEEIETLGIAMALPLQFLLTRMRIKSKKVKRQTCEGSTR